MSQLNVLDMNNKVVGKVSLKEDIFNSEIKEHLLHKSVIAHLANLRMCTHSKKMRRSALISALSLKVKNGDIFVVDKIDIDKPKTKDVVSILKNFKIDRSVLFLIDEKNMNLELSARNIPDVRVQRVDSINVYDLLYYDKIICTKGAIDKIQTTMKQAQGKAQE